MAKFTLTDVSVVLTVSATPYDLSDHIESVTIDAKKDVPEVTAMGSGNRSRTSGLKDWTVQLNLHQDFAAGSVDAAIYAAFMATTNPTILIKPTSAAVSATNPSYAGTVIVPSYSPISGSIGDVSKMSVTIEGSGTLTRATS
jgi:hypothetical protein